MHGLSNLWRSRDAAAVAPGTVAPNVVLRGVEAGEIAVALSLLLGSAEHLAEAAAVIEFEALARLRGIDLAALRIATLDGRLAAVALPVPSPGGTVLLLLSPAGRSGLAAGLVARVADAAVAALPAVGRPLVQILLEPNENRSAAALEAAAFAPLATLIYLQRRLKRHAFAKPDTAGLSCVNYSQQTHDRFARAVEASYVDSLDCPPMRGLRKIDDVIAGHRATGDFDPAWWFCFSDGPADDAPPLGVLLLAPVTAQPMTELVYLGLSPAARGRGLGDLMMKLALHAAADRGHELLTLAVDSSNAPALRLYHRHGMAEIARRVAFFRPPT